MTTWPCGGRFIVADGPLRTLSPPERSPLSSRCQLLSVKSPSFMAGAQPAGCCPASGADGMWSMATLAATGCALTCSSPSPRPSCARGSSRARTTTWGAALCRRRWARRVATPPLPALVRPWKRHSIALQVETAPSRRRRCGPASPDEPSPTWPCGHVTYPPGPIAIARPDPGQVPAAPAGLPGGLPVCAHRRLGAQPRGRPRQRGRPPRVVRGCRAVAGRGRCECC